MAWRKNAGGTIRKAGRECAILVRSVLRLGPMRRSRAISLLKYAWAVGLVLAPSRQSKGFKIKTPEKY
jgi:hypothetical protein